MSCPSTTLPPEYTISPFDSPQSFPAHSQILEPNIVANLIQPCNKALNPWVDHILAQSGESNDIAGDISDGALHSNRWDGRAAEEAVYELVGLRYVAELLQSFPSVALSIRARGDTSRGQAGLTMSGSNLSQRSHHSQPQRASRRLKRCNA